MCRWRNRAVNSQEAAAHSKEAADAACSHAAQLAAELAAGRRDDAAMLEELVCAKLNMALLQVRICAYAGTWTKDILAYVCYESSSDSSCVPPLLALGNSLNCLSPFT